MATLQERRALMAVRCPWCGAGPGVACTPHRGAKPNRKMRVSTLDGYCHEARWKLAVGREALVLAEAVTSLRERDGHRPDEGAAPVTVPDDDERPW